MTSPLVDHRLQVEADQQAARNAYAHVIATYSGHADQANAALIADLLRNSPKSVRAASHRLCHPTNTPRETT